MATLLAHKDVAGSNGGPLYRVVHDLAIWYTFALPVFGVQDMGAATMFANLRVYSGSNHFFLPTSLIFHDAVSDGAFGNGLLRVEDTNSTFIRNMYPTEVSSMLTPQVRSWLTATGHTSRQ